MMADDAWVVVVAAGRGSRFGKPYNKVFHQIDGRSILRMSLDALDSAQVFAGAILVLNGDDMDIYRSLVEREGECPLVKGIAEGGETRSDSVANGLKCLPDSARIVAIHDAARPYVPASVTRACVESARTYGSGVPATPLSDTVKQIDERGVAIRTLDRDTLRAVQTPQAFDLQALKEAYRTVRDSAATDDATLYERKYGGVRLIVLPECRDNIKITVERDIPCGTPDLRIGTGYDAHRLAAGVPLTLCGVHVPYCRGLKGYSDADVPVHALMDALLGAAALGDIGRRFPCDDSRYEGIRSMYLLNEVVAMLDERGYRVVNADITIVAQRPKLSPFFPEMVGNIARALRVSDSCVNVKATTTEGMGFEGQEEGISAQAVALLRGGAS